MWHTKLKNGNDKTCKTRKNGTIATEVSANNTTFQLASFITGAQLLSAVELYHWSTGWSLSSRNSTKSQTMELMTLLFSQALRMVRARCVHVFIGILSKQQVPPSFITMWLSASSLVMNYYYYLWISFILASLVVNYYYYLWISFILASLIVNYYYYLWILFILASLVVNYYYYLWISFILASLVVNYYYYCLLYTSDAADE